MKGSPNRWASQTMEITAVEVDDKNDCVNGAVAYDLQPYNKHEFLDELTATIFIKVMGTCGTRYYTARFIRNPFKRRADQIDDALAGAMYQYSITSNEQTTRAYNQVVRYDRKKYEMQCAFAYYLIIALFFADVFLNLLTNLSVILLLWYWVTALFVMGSIFDALLFNKRRNYQLIFFTIAPMLFGFTLVPGMSMICYMVIVALGIWSIVVQIVKTEMPQELEAVSEKRRTIDD